jgi:hypothetical protein
MQAQPTPGAPVLFLVFVVLAAYAIAGSNKKWKALGFILLSAVLGMAIGAIVGVVEKNASAGGEFAGLLLIIAGAATSIRLIIDNRRVHKKH